jgi:oxygen-independent coproporphyrinogen-3 oxidase
VREVRARTPAEYMRRVALGDQVVERRELGRADLPVEFMMNTLRLAEGFPVAMFSERTGMPITAAERALAQAEARGLLERDHARIRPTALGCRYLNDLLGLFLPEPEGEKT